MPLLFMRQITFILFISNKWPNIFLKLFLLLAKKYTISVNNISGSDVLYMERKLRNTEIHTKSQIYYCCEKIQDLLEQLKPDFCICHKSFAVNINAIHTFSHAGIELSDGTHLPVSRNCYQSTKDSFAQLLLKN